MLLVRSLCLTLLLAASARAATHDVHVGPSGALKFSPADLTVSVGDTVHFIFDTPVHTVTHGTGCNPEPAATSLFNFQSSNSVTLTKAGSVPYFCAFHCSLGMVGHITVKKASSGTATGANTASAGPTPSSTGTSAPSGPGSISLTGIPTGIPTLPISLSGLPTSIPSFTATGTSNTATGGNAPSSTGGQSVSVTAPPTASVVPTGLPSGIPTTIPTGIPTSVPTNIPTGLPTGLPSGLPSGLPTGLPTGFPTGLPTSVGTGSGQGTGGVFNPNGTGFPIIPEVPLFCRDISFLTLFQEEHQALVTLFNHTLDTFNESDIRPCDPVNKTRIRDLLVEMRDDNDKFLSEFRSLAESTCGRQLSADSRADCEASVPCALNVTNAISNTTDLDTLLLLLADLSDHVSAVYRENYLVGTISFSLVGTSPSQTAARVSAVLERQSAVLRLIGGDRPFPSDPLGKPVRDSRTSIRCLLLRYFEPATCCELYNNLKCPK